MDGVNLTNVYKALLRNILCNPPREKCTIKFEPSSIIMEEGTKNDAQLDYKIPVAYSVGICSIFWTKLRKIISLLNLCFLI